MKKKYEPYLEEKKETREVNLGDETISIEYHHKPNVVGPRSVYTGLPIWVGETTATLKRYNVHVISDVTKVAKCWTHEPFDYEQARFIVTGRILKELGHPTNLAEQVKD